MCVRGTSTLQTLSPMTTLRCRNVIVLLWSEFLWCVWGERSRAGVAAFFSEAVLYSVFLSFTETTSAFWSNQTTLLNDKSEQNLFLWFRCGFFPKCEAVLDTPHCDDSLWLTFKGYSGFQHGLEICKYIFQLLGSVSLTCNVFIYVYIYTNYLTYKEKKCSWIYTGHAHQ